MHPIIIAAGGTAGHLSPAEAVAAELVARGQRVVLMTDARSIAATENFPCEERIVLKGAGLAGRGVRRAVEGGLGMIAGVARAARFIRANRPLAVVGFGGYPSVAPVVAARMFLSGWPVPVVLHEQNAVLGRANRLLARGQATLALTYAATTRVPINAYTTVTGNPVRAGIAALAGRPYPATDGRLRLLVTGGSLGARIFSSLVPEAVALLPEALRARIDLVQQVRAEDLSAAQARYAAMGLSPDLAPYFTDMPAQLAAAHLVIARAGASTCAELAAVGRPAVLVPLPGAIDDHQAANAAALAAAGGAITALQPGLTPEALAGMLEALLGDSPRLSAMAAAAQAAGRPDAAAVLAELVLTTVREEVG